MQCLLLTPDELAAKLAEGWQQIGSGHATEEECLVNCGGSASSSAASSGSAESSSSSSSEALVDCGNGCLLPTVLKITPSGITDGGSCPPCTSLNGTFYLYQDPGPGAVYPSPCQWKSDQFPFCNPFDTVTSPLGQWFAFFNGAYWDLELHISYNNASGGAPPDWNGLQAILYGGPNQPNSQCFLPVNVTRAFAGDIYAMCANWPTDIIIEAA